MADQVNSCEQPGAFPALLDEVRVRVDRRLAEVWSRELDVWAGRGRAILEPLEVAQALCLRGGKRLRAGLLAAGFRAASGAAMGPRESPAAPAADAPLSPAGWGAVVEVCAAVELLQSYFLMHDDWMDQDEVRRGGAAVHAALSRSYRSAHLGACGGVLAGDYVVALASRVMAESPIPASMARDAMRLFCIMQRDAVAGQLLDVLDPQPDADEVYRLKTGSYTVVGPLQLGFLLAGRGVAWFDFAAAFGESLGLAFQLQDDLIGLFSEQGSSGKPTGSDLKAGKRTALYQWASERADGPDRAALECVFGNADASRGDVARAISVVESLGARAYVEGRVTGLLRECRNAVVAFVELSPAGRRLLLGAVSAIESRRR